jgi:hypothetical protein
MTTTETHTALSATVDARELLAALAAVKPSVVKRSGLTGHAGTVSLSSQAGSLEVAASDYDTLATVTVPIAGAIGDAYVDHAALVAACKAAGKGPVVVAHDPNPTGGYGAGCLTVGAVAIPVQVREDSANDPYGPRHLCGPSLPLAADELAAVATLIAPTAGTDQARPILTGVLCEATPTGRRWVATDSYGLAWEDSPHPGPVAPVLIPAAVLSRLARLKPASVEMTLSADAGRYGGSTCPMVTFRAGPVTISATCNPGEFPRYRELAPGAAAITGTYDLSAVELDTLRADLAAVVKLAGKDRDTPVRLTLTCSGYDLRFCPVDQQAGYGVNRTMGDLPAGAPFVAFNPRYLLRALAGRETVTVGIVDQLKPVTITSGPGSVALLMPVRVS